MASQALRGEDFAGLALALVLHAGLLALLVIHPGPAERLAAPERISVTLSDEVGLTSTSPEPQARPAAAAAPELAAVPEADPQPEPAPPARPQPAVLPKAIPQPRAAATPRPAPRPVVQPRPAVEPRTAPRAQPAQRVQPAPPQRGASRSIPRPAGANRISEDFLKGVPGAQASGAARNPPAAAIGPAVQSALSGAISRQLKPHWAAPQGAEAERLVSVLAWSLNRDGTLAGTPRLVRQDGITDANRAQAARHAEQAIRAVQLAAPFELPAEYFGAWQRVASFRFDKRLSQ